ncbi:MAG: PHB depolymerase family esterase [Thermomicrobiales bacterium]
MPNASANERSSTGTGTSEAFSFEWDGLDRRYLVYTPAGYDASAPLPVVMAFHGGTGWAERFERTSGLDEMADEFGFLVVYGEGTPVNQLFGNVWNAGDCCARVGTPTIRSMMSGTCGRSSEGSKLPISVDSDRVHATGNVGQAMLGASTCV